ncbi:MAG: hypothetical protein J0H05_00235 [Stenotrophomonas acidaminiphila]|nr:hypothetical protein [Stenotrophomonas acidaminiphila]
MKFFAAALALMLLASGAAMAACSNPAGKAGNIIFSDAAKAMQYCNGTDWINAGAVIADAPQTGCTAPTGKAGGVIYNHTQGVVQFCNGNKWVDTACAAVRKPNGSGCTNPAGTAGAMRYVAGAVNELQFCDSTDWVAMGWPCAVSGTSGEGAPTTPTPRMVSAASPNGIYRSGDVITIQVTFTAPVTVNTSGGTPILQLETGATDRVAVYVSGSGSSDLMFTYMVQPGDASTDLDYTSTSALQLNGAVITSSDGLNASLVLPLPASANSLGAQSDIVIQADAAPPI